MFIVATKVRCQVTAQIPTNWNTERSGQNSFWPPHMARCSLVMKMKHGDWFTEILINPIAHFIPFMPQGGGESAPPPPKFKTTLRSVRFRFFSHELKSYR